MNEAEMDSYIDLTERFLLNDGPIPKDIQLRERFFPRITQQQSVQRTFASNHTDNSFPCNFDSYNSLNSISSLYNSSYHDDYSNNLLRTGNSTTVLTESEQIDKRIDRFRSIYQGIKKSLVYEPITEKTVNDLLLSSNSKKSVKDKEENLNGVRKEGDASRRSKMNEGNSVVLETSSLTSLSSSEEDEEKEKTSGCHERNEEGDNGDEATEEAMERIEREVKEGDDEEQQDEEENSEGNEEESEEGSGSTDDEGGVHLVGYDSELSEGQSESTTMANSDDEIDRDEGRCIDRRKDWIRLSYRIFEKMNEIIGIIDEDSASKNENSVYRKQYDSGRLSFEGLVMVVNLKLFYKIDDLEESGDFEGKASKKRMRENSEGKKKEGDKLLKATDGCIMKDLGDDQTKDIANDSGGVKESQEKSHEKRKNNR
ncbi:expressed protein [Phakopsora pachyrhizi]|uniref:Expressed protein n=1 Tax=Phakopsora pachyrhizi TaxID=170000 RepID=A0AAV0BFL7_PHAPC|nr:expressed protein [Phakopsora pachyrhizi]